MLTKAQNFALSFSQAGLAAALFVAALLPRVFGLGIFITSDEPLWLTRSIFFAEALLSGHLSETLQTGHPGVTTMWTGLFGLGLAYYSHGASTSWGEFLQHLSHDPERIDLLVLPWVRLPTVLLAAACPVLIYRWGRPLLGQTATLIGALLLAFDPLFLAHSRTLHHDALATIFMSLSVLALLNFAAAARPRRSWVILSGGLAGLALLSKGTALVLVAVAGFFWLWLWLGRRWAFRPIIIAGLLWLGLLAGVFVLLWPAMWVIPGRALAEVLGWVAESADVVDVADTSALNWAGRVPELGVLFYPVNWLLKSTPLSILGLGGVIGWWRLPGQRDRRWVLAWLAIFAVLLLALLTIGDKRDGRYLLPIYPGLWLLTAAGLVWLSQWLVALPKMSFRPQLVKVGLAVVFAILLAAFSLPWYPYYHSYYNPLLGGSRLAPRLVKVGWGEGMEQVAAYLNQQEQPQALIVATSYAGTLLPFFAGSAVKHHQAAPSDYVLNYIRQVQNGYPYPEYWEYYRPRRPLLTVHRDGLDYAWLYAGPHLNIVRNAGYAGGLTLLGFTPERWAVQPGRSSLLSLLWRLPQPGGSPALAQVRLQDES
ncbi:MAG: glycosyltransferase family 39 protein, partial [Chloroflexota bacterium]